MGRFALTNTTVQNFFASVIVALGPGIYVAITIMGAGGQAAAQANFANTVNSTLYAVYFFCGLFTGSVVTTIGPKYTFLIGCVGYPVFVGGFWYVGNTGKYGYPIFAGALLGITACLLWTAASFIAFAYPEENRKGRYISMQWGLLSVGSTLASFVAFGINFNATTPAVPISVYIVFIILMLCALPIAAFLIVDPKRVQRSDGSAIRHYPHRGFMIELKNQIELLKDWRILALAIPFFASEIPIIITSTLNALYFNVRTRSLNAVMFNLMQALGAIFISFFLDSEKIGGRRTRGLVSIAVMGSICTGGWIGLVVWLYRNPVPAVDPTTGVGPLLDWTDGPFGGFMVLDLLLGINMVIYQVVAQWIASALSNDPERLARYAGFAKGCLAGGLAVAFGIEAAGLTQLQCTAYMFSIQSIGLVSMVIVVWFCVKPTSVGEPGDIGTFKDVAEGTGSGSSPAGSESMVGGEKGAGEVKA